MKQAKTADRERATAEHKCMCGGTVKMVTVFRNGKLQPCARCTACGKERRKPTQFV